MSVLDHHIGGISNDAVGISLLVFSSMKVVSGISLLIGIKIKNRNLFFPWIFLNCVVFCLSLVSDRDCLITVTVILFRF